MQNVSTKKYAEMCGCSESNIRRMINDGKLKAEKDDSGNYNIDLEHTINRSYYNKRSNKTQQVSQQNEQQAQQVAQEVTQEKHANIALHDSELVLKLAQEIKELSFEAGKAKQLETGLIEKNKDIGYWREKYFELQRTCEQLREELSQLKSELLQKTQQLEAEKKKTIWQRKIF